MYELSVRERAEPKCCAEEMPRDDNYQAGQESDRAKQLRDAEANSTWDKLDKSKHMSKAEQSDELEGCRRG